MGREVAVRGVEVIWPVEVYGPVTDAAEERCLERSIVKRLLDDRHVSWFSDETDGGPSGRVPNNTVKLCVPNNV